MKDEFLDQLFKDSLEKTSHHHHEEQQWNVVKSRLAHDQKSSLFNNRTIYLILALMLLLVAVFYGMRFSMSGLHQSGIDAKTIDTRLIQDEISKRDVSTQKNLQASNKNKEQSNQIEKRENAKVLKKKQNLFDSKNQVRAYTFENISSTQYRINTSYIDSDLNRQNTRTSAYVQGNPRSTTIESHFYNPNFPKRSVSPLNIIESKSKNEFVRNNKSFVELIEPLNKINTRVKNEFEISIEKTIVLKDEKERYYRFGIWFGLNRYFGFIKNLEDTSSVFIPELSLQFRYSIKGDVCLGFWKRNINRTVNDDFIEHNIEELEVYGYDLARVNTKYNELFFTLGTNHMIYNNHRFTFTIGGGIIASLLRNIELYYTFENPYLPYYIEIKPNDIPIHISNVHLIGKINYRLFKRWSIYVQYRRFIPVSKLGFRWGEKNNINLGLTYNF